MPVLPGDADLERQCGPAAFNRGQRYFLAGNVQEIRIREERAGFLLLDASTQGSRNQTYQQDIQLQQHLHTVSIEGHCSCPVGFNCKHVVAATLHFRNQQEQLQQGTSKKIGIRGISQSLQSWLEERAPEEGVDPAQEMTFLEREERLLFIMHHPRQPGASFSQSPQVPVEQLHSLAWIELRKARPRAKGNGWLRGRSVQLKDLEIVLHRSDESGAKVFTDEERRILGMLLTAKPWRGSWSFVPALEGASGFATLQALLASQRLFCSEAGGSPLVWGDSRVLEWNWRKQKGGFLVMEPRVVPFGYYLATDPPCYLDDQTRTIGPLQESVERDEQERQWLLRAPALAESQIEDFARILLSQFPQASVPLPAQVSCKTQEVTVVHPQLRLLRKPDSDTQGHRRHAVALAFQYGDVAVPALPAQEQTLIDHQGELVLVARDADAEKAAIEQLQAFGFTPASRAQGRRGGSLFAIRTDSALQDSVCWVEFMDHGLSKLASAGWLIEYDASFSLLFEPGEWQASAQEGSDWFELRFDLDVEGERLPLAPLLVPIIRDLFDLPPDRWPEILPIQLADDRYVTVSTTSLLPVLDVLRQLLVRGEAPSASWRLERFDALLLADLPDQFLQSVSTGLARLVEQLRDYSGIQEVDPPKGLLAELRPYQQRGLNWLQFLRAYHFNGLLADDMGLGKTLQVLAHLLLEKETGRLDQPALVIVPTSLIGTWRREAERFAPDLRLLILHGQQRHEFFSRIPEYDLVLTTYPLLPRDASEWGRQPFSFLVLDEAQNIKNPDTQAAKILRSISSVHRLCLTGTPMENHLGEIWAQFDFLMPGFLGDQTSFQRNYRTPIEKEGDVQRRQWLAKRLSPFLLRRSKSEVVTELPSKTEILKTVTLAVEQAQLYESVRVMMDDRVRSAIAEKGLARSQITILDALLKLRQICCDPRLLKLGKNAAAEEPNETEGSSSVPMTGSHAQRTPFPSAKLELLMELLPELIEEGRKVLLFSQFTGMLRLIEEHVRAVGIPFVTLTGATRDRDSVIERFRSGEVPLFLISLKAGGVGLTLIEADTVILYDPWWNPAVESQAADRAYRIGQDRPVFIYKLVVENSVEERMLAMQERKRQLAENILEGTEGEATLRFDGDTLRELLAPQGTS